ncbi:hypothetical protein AZA_90078 [Nitrospirillum viridazoti Y2]|uniref:Glycosyl transferase n=2 Tax=Nitrospirillum TaxID=1543705 RepID=A0A560INQ4_9PROT|nr:hypothetical protein [Nitrospirillum amazonense]EGX99431.1 hypothetical protein AZA_90078 [Nitrospirillum amazonense Y2]TWB60608.1 hypothetical protein FBZ92_106169 [Nitrospirillum amazonense]
MPGIHCFTSVSCSYLDRAGVMAETVRRHHPNWTLWLLLSDDPPPGFRLDLAASGFDHVVNSRDLEIGDYRSWAFSHDVVELCTAVKGPMMHKLLAEGADAVVYLDPDIAVFAPLIHVTAMLERHSVILTPHVTTPETTLGGIHDNEIGSLKHGVYNLGFVAVRSCGEGKRFAAWWRDRLIQFCRDDVANGLFTDQRWCDLVPALFRDVGVLHDPGYNVASWNLGSRPITIGPDGVIRAGGEPLRFFHFTKVNSVGESMLARYAYGDTEVFELLRWYRQRLKANAPQGIPDRWWAYGTYSDGTPIPRSHRLTWRDRLDVRTHFKNPLTPGIQGFQAWCAAEGIT